MYQCLETERFIFELLINDFMKTSISHRLLTNREQEIIFLLAYEHSTQEIADKLFVSFETVKTHRRNIMYKMGARNIAGVVRRAFQLEILT